MEPQWSIEPITILAALSALVLPALREIAQRLGGETYRALERFIGKSLGFQPSVPQLGFAERMQTQTASLQKASNELETLLLEMQGEAARHETAVAELEAKVAELSQREHTLQSRIEVLNQTNPKAAQEFITMMEQRQAVGERRSAKRDYVLFAGGVVVTIGLTLLFNALGIGS